MNNLHINEADQLVSEYLQKANIKYNAIYTGDKSLDKEWPCDSWLIQFNGVGFDYNTGIGYRIISTKKGGSYNYMNFDRKVGMKLKKLRSALCKTKNESIYFKTNTEGAFAVTPTQASVLYCLLLDAGALDTSFTNWADDFGYDQDSLKALSIYNACCDNAKLLNTIFSRQQQDDLSELLEDY